MRTLVFYIITLFVVTSSCQSLHAETYIDEQLGKFGPSYQFEMEPSQYKKQLILPGNEDDVGGIILIKFKEARGYYGFSVLICDEDNTTLYENRKKASCYRRNIDKSTDTLKFKFEGGKKYYLFVINNSRPLSVNRVVTIESYIAITLNEAVRDKLKGVIQDINDTFISYFDMKPYNVAIVPCVNNVIPSSYGSRTLTMCSEFLFTDNVMFDADLVRDTFMYEVAPHLLRDWQKEELIETEKDRLQLTAMLVMLFSETLDPFVKYLTLHQKTQDLEKIVLHFGAYDIGMTYIDRINVIIDIINQPFARVDRWIDVVYEQMTSPTLEKIKTGELNHYGYLRNDARMILKQRFERDNPAEGDGEPDNIISDFW